MVTLHNLLEHLAANTWVILKIAIISFFIVNCWPYAVESALLNFAKNAFIILPYTHDIHVLAVHVEMSLFMMLNQIGFLRSCRASPLRSTLRNRTPRAERASVSADVLTRWSFAPATLTSPLDYCEVSGAVNGHRVCCRMLTWPYRNYSVCFEEMVGICWKGFHGQPRGQLVLSYSLVTIRHKSLILNQVFFNSL